MATSPVQGGEGTSNFGSKRPRLSSIQDNVEDAVSSISLLDTELLACPICFERLTGKIFQCVSGHVVCSSCHEKMKFCSQCRYKMGKNRCIIMEKVVQSARVSCRNARYGCKVNPVYADQLRHEKDCLFSPCQCPVMNCNHTGYYKDLTRHITQIHKLELVSFRLYSDIQISLETNRATVLLQQKDAEEMFVFQTFPFGDGAVKVTVTRIAPSVPSAGELSCTVSVTRDSVPLSVQRLMVTNYPNTDEPTVNNYGLIASWLCEGRGFLHMLVRIGRGTTYGERPAQ